MGPRTCRAQFATSAARLDLAAVPHRGQPGAMTPLLAGDTDVFFNQTGAAMGPIRQGQVRPIVVMTRERRPRCRTCRWCRSAAAGAPMALHLGTGCSARQPAGADRRG
jgi:tripartite-type tricarboxylate transporter receptor subunit TctC